MPIAPFHEMLLQLLRRSADGSEWTNTVLGVSITDDFALADTERQVLLPSSTQYRFVNRPCSAKIYLEQAGLIAGVRRNAVISTGEKYASHSPPASTDSRSSWRIHRDQASRPRMEPIHAAICASY